MKKKNKFNIIHILLFDAAKWSIELGKFGRYWSMVARVHCNHRSWIAVSYSCASFIILLNIFIEQFHGNKTFNAFLLLIFYMHIVVWVCAYDWNGSATIHTIQWHNKFKKIDNVVTDCTLNYIYVWLYVIVIIVIIIAR